MTFVKHLLSCYSCQKKVEVHLVKGVRPKKKYCCYECEEKKKTKDPNKRE